MKSEAKEAAMKAELLNWQILKLYIHCQQIPDGPEKLQAIRKIRKLKERQDQLRKEAKNDTKRKSRKRPED